MKLNKSKSGISLIVLVITIIVMIIIAATIILSLDGNNIVGRANEAKKETDVSARKEAATVYLGEYNIKVAKKQIDPEKMSAIDYVKEPMGGNINNFYVNYVTIPKTSEYIKPENASKNLVYQSSEYWLSSTCNWFDFSSCLEFHMRSVTSSELKSRYLSDGILEVSYRSSLAVRPVVELFSDNIKITYDGTTVTLK